MQHMRLRLRLHLQILRGMYSLVGAQVSRGERDRRKRTYVVCYRGAWV